MERTRKRFIEGNLERALNEDPRPGAKRKLDDKQEAFLIATACSTPPDGRSKWTTQLLADRSVGGNDALQQAHRLLTLAASTEEALGLLADLAEQFEHDYRAAVVACLPWPAPHDLHHLQRQLPRPRLPAPGHHRWPSSTTPSCAWPLTTACR